MNTITHIQNDWFDVAFNIALVCQVVITTLLIPLILRSKYAKYLKVQSLNTEKSRQNNNLITKATMCLNVYVVVSLICAALSISIILPVLKHSYEILNWDNQAGITVLFVLAYLPIGLLAFFQQKVFSKVSKAASSTRTASLQPSSWIDFISKPALSALIIGQLLFVSAVIYYFINPFPGFGGALNFLGILFLDGVMGYTIYLSINNRGLFKIDNLNERNQMKQLAVNVNLFIWILASYHLAISLILSGEQLKEYSLILQSIYLQVIFFASIKIFDRLNIKPHLTANN
jgi:hypothetical protein